MLSAVFYCLSLLVFAALSCSQDTSVEGQYEPYEPKNAFFCEPFVHADRWTSSKDPVYEGTFTVGSGSQSGLAGDTGLLVPDEAKKYAISAPFDSPLDLNNDLVVQYEVRYHINLECGGAYLKLLSQPEEGDEFDPEEFGGDSQYTIMFGPDKCGPTNKVHFIFKHRNPVSNELIEHHLRSPPTMKNDRFTHLYTLIIRTDNTFEILIDNESTKKGSLLEDFDPPVNPPAEIEDPDDEKPEDWIDEPTMPDPEAVKPDGWDEDAPMYIIDETSTMPDDWYPDEPFEIPDPDAEKPEDWVDEFDGEFEPPTIPNPLCEFGNCGEWEAEEIENPDYVGPWEADEVENPDYIGEWEPRRISNPNFFEEDNPLKNLIPIIAVGFEIWTIQNDVEFDNIFIGNDIAAAADYAENTFELKNAAEKAQVEEPEDESEVEEGSFLDSISDYVGPLEPIQEFATDNPMLAVGVTAMLILLPLLLFTRSGESKEEQENDDGKRTTELKTQELDESEDDEEEEEEEEEDDGGQDDNEEEEDEGEEGPKQESSTS